MDNNWLVAGLLFSPCLYLLVTLRNRPARTEADFEFGSRKLHPSQVLDSSITYSLQVAAIALFATWGYIDGFWALLVPLFWFVGYVLLAALMTPDRLKTFALDDRFRTLHSFIADAGQMKIICVVAATITLIALAGPAMYEAFTVGRTVASSLPIFGPAAGAGIALAFLGMSIVYIIWGGFIGVVRLDRLQLAFGYGGFCLAFAIAICLFADRIGRPIGFDLALLGFVTASVMAAAKVVYEVMTYRYLGDIDQAYGPVRSVDRIGLAAMFASVIFFGVAAAYLSRSASLSLTFAPSSPLIINSHFGFTALAVVSLALANGLFQFVDITQWQRLLSIAVDRNALTQTASILRGNILFGGFCGSGTWVIAVLFGLFLRYLFPAPGTDPYALLPAFLRLVTDSATLERELLAFVFVGCLVSIMSSTVDAMVSATSFTVRNDFISVGLNRAGSSTLSRVATVVAILLQLGIYLYVSERAQSHVDAVLYVCYSFQLSLLPSVVAVIVRGRSPRIARLLSMAAGCVGACTPLFLGDPERAYELSPLLSVTFSWFVFFLLGGLWRRSATVAG